MISIFFLIIFATNATKTVLALEKSSPLRIYGHRGDSHSYTPNTISSIVSAFNKVEGAEIDIRLSADGHLFVFHDETFEKISAAESKHLPGDLRYVPVESLTLPQIQLIAFDSNEKIPLLSDVLEILATQAFNEKGLLIEIKVHPKEGNQARIYDALKRLFSVPKYKSSLPRISFISFDTGILEFIVANQKDFGAAKTFLITTAEAIDDPKEWASHLEKSKYFTGMDLESNVNLLQKDGQGFHFTDHLKSQNKEIITWINRTKRTDGIIFKLISAQVGVDIFTSDLPLEVWNSSLYRQRIADLKSSASLGEGVSQLFKVDSDGKTSVVYNPIQDSFKHVDIMDGVLTDLNNLLKIPGIDKIIINTSDLTIADAQKVLLIARNFSGSQLEFFGIENHPRLGVSSLRDLTKRLRAQIHLLRLCMEN